EGRAGPTFDDVAARIAAAERELEDAARRLSDPELYRDAVRVREERARYEVVQRRLETLYALLDDVADEQA
ncbi:MAG TPA: hypothetical protein VNN19_03340, partial [bacterium]|nr:hypothetical protein [bacterium]